MMVGFLTWSSLLICPYWKLISNGRCLWHPWKVALAELWCWQHWNCCNLFCMGTRLIFDLDLLVDLPIGSFTWRCLWQNSDVSRFLVPNHRVGGIFFLMPNIANLLDSYVRHQGMLCNGLWSMEKCSTLLYSMKYMSN